MDRPGSSVTTQSRMFWSRGTTASYSLNRPDEPLLAVLIVIRHGGGFTALPRNTLISTNAVCTDRLRAYLAQSGPSGGQASRLTGFEGSRPTASLPARTVVRVDCWSADPQLQDYQLGKPVVLRGRHLRIG